MNDSRKLSPSKCLAWVIITPGASFEKEARMPVALDDHPGMLSVYDWGRANEGCYVVSN
ncbi:MAG: hypothetical protein M2R45_00543 [Verrucomicrobia subdivision 3 bacterium]|nr:hypothetical protein [Limisphaerales bacterium]MCS1413579.1 hypothetical protein [Limisphaerales bacterium]